MDIKDIIGLINLDKAKASILADLVDGDLLDKIYEALKPSIIKAIKEGVW